jgi:hypothetical protein
MKNKLLLLSIITLQGCAVVAEYPLATASLAVMGATGKGPADHALSYVAERDCNTLNLIDGRKICQDVNKETVLAIVDRLDYSATTVAIANDVFAQRARMNR